MEFIDIHLLRAVVYVGLFCIEFWPAGGHAVRWLLAAALLMLALLSACESGTVRNMHMPVMEPLPVIYGWPGIAPMAEIGTRRVGASV